MKFLIIALLALPVCLAQSIQAEEYENFYQEEVESGLQEIFNLTPDGMKKECNVDFESVWLTIGAALDEIRKISDDFDIEAAKHFEENDSSYEDRILDTCRKSEPFKKERKKVIKTALPCAEEDRVSDLMKISEINTCEI